MRTATLALLILAACVVIAGPAAGQPCNAGFSSPDGNAPCDPCPPGRYASDPGSMVCQVCLPGTYTSLPGSAACLACPVGTYTDVEGSTGCTTCPEGTIAPVPGTAVCQACPSGQTNNPSHSECVPVTVPARPSTWGLLKSRYL